MKAHAMLAMAVAAVCGVVTLLAQHPTGPYTAG